MALPPNVGVENAVKFGIFASLGQHNEQIWMKFGMQA